MIYIEPFVCKVCGHTEKKPIIVSGDYDGSEEIRELKDCVKCSTLKETVPALYKRMLFLAEELEKQKGQVYSWKRCCFDIANEILLTANENPKFKILKNLSNKSQKFMSDAFKTH